MSGVLITGNVAKATSTCSPGWSSAPGGPCAPTGTCARSTADRLRKFGGFGSPLAKKKAIIAVAHKLITIVWHVLTTRRPYQDLGADDFTSRLDPEIETRRLVAKLQAQGYTVTLEPAA